MDHVSDLKGLHPVAVQNSRAHISPLSFLRVVECDQDGSCRFGAIFITTDEIWPPESTGVQTYSFDSSRSLVLVQLWTRAHGCGGWDRGAAAFV